MRLDVGGRVGDVREVQGEARDIVDDMSDGGLLGPVLASLATGVALLVQSWLTSRREERKHRQELEETRRKEAVQTRDQWVAVFQEGLSTMSRFIGDNRVSMDAIEAKGYVWKGFDLIEDVKVRARVATSRLLLVEQNVAVRTRVQSLVHHFEAVVVADDTLSDVRQRLTKLQTESIAFLDDLAEKPSPLGRLKRLEDSLVESSGLPPETIQELAPNFEMARRESLALPGSPKEKVTLATRRRG